MEPVLGLLAVQLGVAQVDQDQVHVGAAGEDGDAHLGDVRLDQALGEDPGAVQVRCWRSLNSSPAAILNETALAAITCSSGPPC